MSIQEYTINENTSASVVALLFAEDLVVLKACFPKASWVLTQGGAWAAPYSDIAPTLLAGFRVQDGCCLPSPTGVRVGAPRLAAGVQASLSNSVQLR